MPNLLSGGTSQSPPTDIGRLADKVYQMLVKRLASERERRGAQ
jgi:hypothetical protein